jgi:hypothetical protein
MKISRLLPLLFCVSTAAHSGNWQYGFGKDTMRGTETRTASLESINRLVLDPPYDGLQRLEIFLQRKGKNTDSALIVERGQFDCSFRGCEVSMKFDNGPVLSFRAESAGGGHHNVLLLHNTARLVSALKKSKKLIVEVHFWSNGSRQLEFDVDTLIWP